MICSCTSGRSSHSLIVSSKRCQNESEQEDQPQRTNPRGPEYRLGAAMRGKKIKQKGREPRDGSKWQNESSMQKNALNSNTGRSVQVIMQMKREGLKVEVSYK